VRILHVIDRYWPAPGGAERHLQEYAERQARDGHEVAVFTTDALDLEYFWDRGKRRVGRDRDRHNGVRIERFPVRHLPPGQLGFRVARRLLGELDRAPLTAPLLRRLCRLAPSTPELRLALWESAGRFDVVHGMNIAFESLLWPAWHHARAAGVPFLISPLTHLGESERSLVRRYYTMKHQIELIRRADVVFTQTPTEVAYLKSRGVDPARMVVAGAGVNPAELGGGDADRFRARHGLDGPIVFSVGAMARDKGSDHLVEAMERLWARGVEATLVMAGASMEPFRQFLAGRPARTRARTLVLGYVDEATKRDLFAAGDVFAQPSRTDSFGIVYLEAWLQGAPVVAAAAGGVPDVVGHERGGLVIPFGDVEAIANAIARLLRDREEAARMAAWGAEQARGRYTWDHVYARVRPAFERGARR
jgi:glycosyltransferase involved in cell wall biosynthesis